MKSTPPGTPQEQALSRREFVRRTTLATAAVAATGMSATHAAPAAAMPRRGDVLRVGLIGCGGRGTGAAVNALRADPYAVLWATGDLFPERHAASIDAVRASMAELDEEQGLQHANQERVQVEPSRRYSGWDNHLGVIESCDVVLLCTPPVFRPRQVADAVAAGRHIFCEKPVAVDAPGVRSVMESARRAAERTLAMVSGFCWRYSARERETYRRIHEGALGDLRAVYTTYNATGWVTPRPRKPEWSDVEWQVRNWHYFHWMSGDHIVEQAVHAIDKIHWAFNGRLPLRCVAVGGRAARPAVPETGNVYDHFSVTWEYDDGARAFHMCRHYPNCPSDNSDYLLGALGTCTVNGWTDTHEITGANAWRCDTPRNDMYQQEHDELFASIRAGQPINDGRRMCESTLMAIMGRMAAYTGQEVTWTQALESDENLAPDTWDWGARPFTGVAVPGSSRVV